MLCHQMFNLAMGLNFHTTAFHFVHSSLVDQLHATVINSVRKSNNPVWDAPNIHPNVFNSFLRTVIHGETYRVFTNPSPSNVSLHFTIEPLPSATYPFFSLEPTKLLKSKFIFSPLWKRLRTARSELCLAIH